MWPLGARGLQLCGLGLGVLPVPKSQGFSFLLDPALLQVDPIPESRSVPTLLLRRAQGGTRGCAGLSPEGILQMSCALHGGTLSFTANEVPTN